MSLLGLSLAIGVLIDDAIVVRENIVRHMERGEDRARPRARAPPRSAWRWPPPPFHRGGVRAGGLHARVSGEWFRPFG
jgi:HAE1 family hydrophobic/amphiphilic exporter-1